MNIKGIEVHPAANIFPMMGPTAFAELLADMREHGQRESCSTYKGQLIDGRNRWLACQELGIEPSVGEFEDENFDVLAYVLSVNLHRRHLSDSQLAMVGLDVLAYHKARAKERMKAGGKAAGNGRQKGCEDFPTPKVRATDEAGAAVGVSGKSVEHAATVMAHGSTELIAAVKADEVSVSKAAKIAKSVPKREQLAAAKAPRKKRAKKAKPAPKPEVSPAQPKHEPNTIGELRERYAAFVEQLIEGQPAHVIANLKEHSSEVWGAL